MRVFARPGNASNLCDLADYKGNMNPLDEARLSLVAWQCLDECNQRLEGGDDFDGCCVSLCEYTILPSPLDLTFIFILDVPQHVDIGYLWPVLYVTGGACLSFLVTTVAITVTRWWNNREVRDDQSR